MPRVWTETTRERYWDALECLPPAARTAGAFLVGEPMDHHPRTGKPTFACYKQVGEKYYGLAPAITHAEFCTLFGACANDYRS